MLDILTRFVIFKTKDVGKQSLID